MEVMALLACPAAIIMAVGAFFVDQHKMGICTMVSYVCSVIPITYCVLDLRQKTIGGEEAAMLTTYPVLFTGICVLFGLVTVLNVFAFIKRRKG